MFGIFKEFISDLINEAIAKFSEMLSGALANMLHVEKLMAENGGALTAGNIANMYNYIYLMAVSLITLKFLFKGFSIYILWRDGDADSSPQSMLMGAAQGVVIAVAFPTLYDIMASVTLTFANTLMGYVDIGEVKLGMLTALHYVSGGIIELSFILLYLVMYAVMYVKLLSRGFELLILRLGVPFACMGLIDSDSGIFKSYMQIFYKSMFTSVIQVSLLSLSVAVVVSGHIIIGIAIITTAFATPVIMQQILIPAGRGGGITNKVYAASMGVRAVGMLRGG